MRHCRLTASRIGNITDGRCRRRRLASRTGLLHVCPIDRSTYVDGNRARRQQTAKGAIAFGMGVPRK